MDSYEDIINLPHPVSTKHKPMAMIERAAQFAPFAALTGHDAVLAETARLTDDAVNLDEYAKAMIDEKLRGLVQDMKAKPQVTVTYFVPDARKAGGAYTCITGQLKRIDEVGHLLLFEDGTQIPVDRILDVEY